ncbi:MAG: hypothetical protein Q8Q33_10850 [Chlamydiota bacterium]|nr:hypothetical protein [Chlamydiota bacterium]
MKALGFQSKQSFRKPTFHLHAPYWASFSQQLTPIPKSGLPMKNLFTIPVDIANKSSDPSKKIQ